ncbi:hypothetical protein PHLCEN_2v2588 [Hermanssonia centrifuga]|uniref:DUF6535 domain-containing protein n=1 Tax=Hermanssonia centrifuga TaxID=98765 RepID=A0A2R6RLF3_9APHY|nr:hypothetical protein PHLCEN_2v2588 [Hermanssonia centrifuga]
MAKTLKAVDQDKVGDCKEDIDTLLVFAGLFAAVLTPFLAETYQTLSEDPNDTAVLVLRQIFSQTRSYTMHTGFLNTTAPLEDTVPFVPPLFSLPINILWFASLTLAVVTASFGILVKQWLREYMSVESTSAQACLRIRQFRLTGLEDWKVFDIAAVLPLLLQISLGFFFVGLCFFSWSVHSAIGYTITPIVFGWVVLFFFATIAPMISAHCPYKTTLLKGKMRSLRKLICSTQLLRWLYIGPTQDGCTAPVEEGDVQVDAKQDIRILHDADGVLLDGNLLDTTMVNSLQDTDADPEDIMTFVLDALRQRLPYHIPDRTLLLDLEPLSVKARTTVVNIAYYTLNKYMSGNAQLLFADLGSYPWTQDATTILLSVNHESLSPEAQSALNTCLNEALLPTCRYVRLQSDHTNVFKNLRHAFNGQSVEDTLTKFCTIVSVGLRESSSFDLEDDCPSLKKLLSSHSGDLPGDDIGSLLRSWTDHRISTAKDGIWKLSSGDMELITAGCAVWHDRNPEFLNTFLQNPSLVTVKDPSVMAELCMCAVCGARCYTTIPSDGPDSLTSRFRTPVRHIMVESTAQALIARQLQGSIAWDDWDKDAVALILSFANAPLSSNTQRAIEGCMEFSPLTMVQIFGSRNRSSHISEGLSHILGRLRGTFSLLAVKDLLKCMLS